MQERKLYAQPPVELKNQFIDDTGLLDYLAAMVPKELLEKAVPDLYDIGDKAAKEYMNYAIDAERNPPKLENYDAWGNRVDIIHTTWGWKKEKEVAARDGIVAFGYEEQYGKYSRLLQFTRLYMFAPSSGLFSCPLAMTDGAAFLIKNILKKEDASLDPKVKSKLEEAFQNLTSRDPTRFWTSGQWMTERKGGSDVSRATETVAVHVGGPVYKLYGDKWFTSATDSDMTFTLARIVDPNDEKKVNPPSLFFVKLREKDGHLNGITILKLKDKMGTRQLPTAELVLNGTVAYLVSAPEKGVRSIADMLTVTRIYNSVVACGAMRRIIAMSRDFNKKRMVFGKLAAENKLQASVLFDMELTLRASLLLTLFTTTLFGKVETGSATKVENDIFRILTPVIKLFTAKECMKVMSEGVESFGAQGYIESTNIPVIMRDAQVLPIWEGTTNVLCNDFIRALVTGSAPTERLESFATFFREVSANIVHSDSDEFMRNPDFKKSLTKLILSYNNLYADLHELLTDVRVLAAKESLLRKFTFGFARLFVALLFGQHALKTGRSTDVFICVRWINSVELYFRSDESMPLAKDQQLQKEIGLNFGDKTRLFRVLGEGYYKHLNPTPKL